MVIIGNHMKMDLPEALRDRARAFYVDVVECQTIPSPRPDLDLYQFAGGFVIGLFFGSPCLSESEHERATWLELKTDDPEALRRRLEAFGVRKIDYEDRARFYFQAPGGQIFRVAPMDGGL
jgi:hypothetical protein